VADYHVDRPEVEREQSPQLTGTNRSIGLIHRCPPIGTAPPPACSVKPLLSAFAGAGSQHANRHFCLPHITLWAHHPLGLVAIARGQAPDPIPNSAVKTLRAHGTAAQAAEESVAARPNPPPNALFYLLSRRLRLDLTGNKADVLAITSTRAILPAAAPL
jgi:hypothetical protein